MHTSDAACGLCTILPAQCALDDQRFSYSCAFSRERSLSYHALSAIESSAAKLCDVGTGWRNQREPRRHSMRTHGVLHAEGGHGRAALGSCRLGARLLFELAPACPQPPGQLAGHGHNGLLALVVADRQAL